MAVHLIFAIALAAGSAGPTPEPELCAGTVRQTEPQYQVLESDLDHAAAVRAAERLRDKVAQGQVHGEFQYGVLNLLKILKGHVMLEQALVDRHEFGVNSAEASDSKASFCAWLAKEGFWYD